MKKLLLTLALTVAIVGTAYATETEKSTSKSSHPVSGSSTHSTSLREHTHKYIDRDTDTRIDHKEADDLIFGAKFDAPNLIKKDAWSLGTEVSKDLLHTSADEGWSIFAKATWTGTFFDFSKKE